MVADTATLYWVTGFYFLLVLGVSAPWPDRLSRALREGSAVEKPRASKDSSALPAVPTRGGGSPPPPSPASRPGCGSPVRTWVRAVCGWGAPGGWSGRSSPRRRCRS